MPPNSAEGQQRIASPLARGAIGQRGPFSFWYFFFWASKRKSTSPWEHATDGTPKTKLPISARQKTAIFQNVADRRYTAEPMMVAFLLP